MKRRTEAVTPIGVVHKLLAAAGDDLVLVGGQALAFWVRHYQVVGPDPRMPAISNDVDFLTIPTDVDAVERLAEVINGKALILPRDRISALVGQAIRPVSETEFLNVDVIFKVVGLTRDDVRKRAVRVERPGEPSFLVMHPLDVLRSRTANLHQIPDKKNDKGAMQLSLAVAVAREFLRVEAEASAAKAVAQGRSPIQDYVSAIEQLACEDAARKIIKLWDIFVADAIDPLLVPAGPFWTKRWPLLRTMMSPVYRVHVEAEAVARQLLQAPDDDGSAPEPPGAPRPR